MSGTTDSTESQSHTITQPSAQETKRPVGFTFSRTIINFWLDFILLVLMMLLAWVSAILQFVFPSGAAKGYSLWGGNVEVWRGFQFGVLSALGLGVILHLMLHWSWICGVISRHILGRKPGRDDGTQTLLGVAALAIALHILAIGVLVAWYCLKVPE